MHALETLFVIAVPAPPTTTTVTTTTTTATVTTVTVTTVATVAVTEGEAGPPACDVSTGPLLKDDGKLDTEAADALEGGAVQFRDQYPARSGEESPLVYLLVSSTACAGQIYEEAFQVRAPPYPP